MKWRDHPGWRQAVGRGSGGAVGGQRPVPSGLTAEATL